MKRKVVLGLLVGCLLLTGCTGKETSKNAADKDNQQTQEGAKSEKAETTNEGNSDGLTVDESMVMDMENETMNIEIMNFDIADTDLKVGNSSANLSSGGYVCETSKGVYFVDENRNLVLSKGGSESVVQKDVKGGINFYNNDLYFINAQNDNLMVMKGGTKKPEVVIKKSVHSAMVCKDGVYYNDSNHKIYFKDWNSEEGEQIISSLSDYFSYYKGNIFYSSQGNENAMSVMSYNTQTKKSEEAVNKGMNPVVYDNILHFQGDDLCTHKVNIDTIGGEMELEYYSACYTTVGKEKFFYEGGEVFKLDKYGQKESIYKGDTAEIKGISAGDGILYIKAFDCGKDVVKRYNVKSGKMVK